MSIPRRILLTAIILLVPFPLLAVDPLPLHEVKKIYVSAMSNDLDVAMVQQILKWGAVQVVAEREQADAVLIGASDKRVVGTQTAVATRLDAEVTLLERKNDRPIWSTRKKTGRGTLRLAQDIVDQLRKDWEKSSKRQETKPK